MSLLAPPVNRAMRVLDRSFFQKELSIAAARVFEVRDLARIKTTFQKHHDLFLFRQVTPVQPDPSPDAPQGRKCILLKPEIKHNDKSTWPETVKQLLGVGEISLIPFKLHLNYDHWTAHEILASVLPEDLLQEVPTGFAAVGHIAQFNLREPYLPYKTLIGQIALDKNPSIRTVINKRDSLNAENEYRVLDYELLAGDEDFIVEAKEWNSSYRFDFSKVFWNSRLSTEHQRLVGKFLPREAVCDVMAGVGPFAIPAGKKGVFVWANDLNPDCFVSLEDSIALNNVSQFVQAFKQDGHTFIKDSAAALLSTKHTARIPIKFSRSAAAAAGTWPAERFKYVAQPKTFAHYVMNLPSTAPDFLLDFRGLYAGCEALFAPHTGVRLPMVHCYCFGPKVDVAKVGDAGGTGDVGGTGDAGGPGETASETTTSAAAGNDTSKTRDEEQEELDSKRHVCELVSEKLGATIALDMEDVEVFDVRDVAPNKRQFCVSFRLPAEVAFAAG